MTLCEEAMHYIRASVSSPPPPTFGLFNVDINCSDSNL